jgi:prevent-host-death family protein
MDDGQRRTRTIKASQAHAEWGRLLDSVRRKEARVLVEKDGVPVAAIVSADDLERLNRFDTEREERFSILDEMGQAFADESPEEADRQVQQAIADVRAQRPGSTARHPE